jgi:hypothetical protein
MKLSSYGQALSASLRLCLLTVSILASLLVAVTSSASASEQTLAFNFQSSSGPIPSGWIADTGDLYSIQAGYGWVPSDAQKRQCGDRNRDSDQVSDTFCHAQNLYEKVDGSWRDVDSPALWQLDLPNGTYSVEVTVGDSWSRSTSIRHSVQAEGQVIFDRVSTTSSTPTRTSSATVSVADGRLTLTFDGGTRTKLVSVVVSPVGAATTTSVATTQPPSTSTTSAVATTSTMPSVSTSSPASTTAPVTSSSSSTTSSAVPASTTSTSAANPPFGLAVNFQKSGAPIPSGWVADTGRALDSSRGYGWVLPDGQDRQCGDRNATSNQVVDTFCHATTRHAFSNGSWNAIASPATWLAVVPDGQYEVAVTVGESSSHGSSVRHSVSVEDVVVHDRVVTSAQTPTRTATAQVEVDDGRLDVSFEGGLHTKVVAIEIVRLGASAPTSTTSTSPATTQPTTTTQSTTTLPATTVQSTTTQPVTTLASTTIPVEGSGGPDSIAVNFQPSNGASPQGWVADVGEPFSTDRGFGWELPDGNDRQCGDRNASSDQVIDTFCHATTRYVRTSDGWQAITSPATWFADVANGSYLVSVSVGESKSHSSSIKHSVQIEGVTLHDRVTTDSSTPVRTATATVVVADGRLDMSFDGGIRTKVVSLRATRIESAPSTTSPVTTSPSTTTTAGPTTTLPSPDPEAVVVVDYAFSEGYDVFASDSSDNGYPLDLFAGYYGPDYSWTSTGLAVRSSSEIATPGPASKVLVAIGSVGAATSEVWLNTGSPTASPAVVAGLMASPSSYHFVLRRDGESLVWLADSGAVELSAPVRENSVVHAALVVTATRAEFWLDDVLVDTASVSSSNPFESPDAARLVIGSAPDGSQGWAGTIEHFRVSSGVVSGLGEGANSVPGADCDGPLGAISDLGGTDALGRSYVGVYLSEADLDAALAKTSSFSETARREVISHADAMLCQRSLSVTANGGGNSWVADRAYVVDGEVDPTADRSDYRMAERLSRGLVALGWAYRITGDGRYAQHALGLIDEWAINPATRFVPHITSNNREIEIYITQPGIIFGADLIWSYGGWTQAQRQSFVGWVGDLADAYIDDATSNNIDLWRLNLLAVAGRFTGRAELTAYALGRYTSRVGSLISPDGVMLTEIDRTRSLFYSVFGASALVNLAEILRLDGHNLYAVEGGAGQTLLTALDNLATYLVEPDPIASWPYEEIGPLYAGDLQVAAFEVAHARYPQSNYAAVISQWGRPMFIRTGLGPVTLSHSVDLSTSNDG